MTHWPHHRLLNQPFQSLRASLRPIQPLIAKALAVSRDHKQPTRADLKDAFHGVSRPRVPPVNVPITLQALSFALYPPRPLDPALHRRGGRAAEAGSGARRRGGARRRLGAVRTRR